MQKLDIKIQQSKQLLLIWRILLIGTLIIIHILPIFILIKMLLDVVIFWLFCNVLRRTCAIDNLSYDKSGWKTAYRGREEVVTMCGSSTVTAYVAILRCVSSINGSKKTYLIFRDAMRSDLYRQLLMILA